MNDKTNLLRAGFNLTSLASALYTVQSCSQHTASHRNWNKEMVADTEQMHIVASEVPHGILREMDGWTQK